MFVLISFQKAQQQQYGKSKPRKGGVQDFLALVNRAPMGSQVIPADAVPSESVPTMTGPD